MKKLVLTLLMSTAFYPINASDCASDCSTDSLDNSPPATPHPYALPEPPPHEKLAHALTTNDWEVVVSLLDAIVEELSPAGKKSDNHSIQRLRTQLDFAIKLVDEIALFCTNKEQEKIKKQKKVLEKYHSEITSNSGIRAATKERLLSALSSTETDF